SRFIGMEARQQRQRAPKPYKRSLFGRVIGLIVLNPVGPFLALAVAGGAVFSIFGYYGENNNGTEFFTSLDAERATVHIRARGNTSLEEEDRLVRLVENRLIAIDGIASVFAFAGQSNAAQGQDSPPDSVGQVQIELESWRTRRPAPEIMADVRAAVTGLPGFEAEIAEQEEGPQQGKPIQLELKGRNWEDLLEAAAIARAQLEASDGLVDIDDTRPLPGIEWQVAVDRATAGRYGADIAGIGPFVQF
ncbi:MAG: efflux RND transporter permease subunit, partial [Pseudomonadota bacterium]